MRSAIVSILAAGLIVVLTACDTTSDDESGVFYALIDAYLDDIALQPVRIGPPHHTGGWIILNANHQQGYWWDRDPDEDSDSRW